jgi:hypothetical protein
MDATLAQSTEHCVVIREDFEHEKALIYRKQYEK